MKLSEILGWKTKRPVIKDQGANNQVKDKAYCRGHKTALTSCDREIDREALAKELYREFFNAMSWENLSENSRVIYRSHADRFISTMPTWLKRSEK